MSHPINLPTKSFLVYDPTMIQVLSIFVFCFYAMLSTEDHNYDKTVILNTYVYVISMLQGVRSECPTAAQAW